MNLNKSDYILTFVISIIIFNNHKSDANYCIEQIIGYGNMIETFNGADAFKFAYLNYNTKSINESKQYILKKYFENHLSRVLKVGTSHIRTENPMKWMANNYSGSSITSFCDINSSFKTSKQHAYFSATQNNFEDEVNKGYYEYILGILLTLVPEANIQGPLEFCNNYKVSTCKNQIVATNVINYNWNSYKTFGVIYRRISLADNSDTSIEKDILHQYAQELFDAVVPNDLDNLIHSPLNWCISYLELPEYMLRNGKDSECRKIISHSLFNLTIHHADRALKTAYFDMDYDDDMQDDPLIGYYEYMIQEILSNFDFSNAKSPKTFCERHFPPDN